MSIDGGYDGEKEEAYEAPPHNQWKLVEIRQLASRTLIASLRCNGVEVGLIYPNDQEDLEWLQSRLNKTQPKLSQKNR